MRNHAHNMEEIKTMNIRIMLDEWKFIASRAKSEQMSINSVLRQYIRKDMKKGKKDEKKLDM